MSSQNCSCNEINQLELQKQKTCIFKDRLQLLLFLLNTLLNIKSFN